MIFQSQDFLILLGITFSLYWALRPVSLKLQNLVLLSASFLFYGYVTHWLVLLLGSYIAIGFLASYGFRVRPQDKSKILITSVIAIVGILGVFKYLGFALEGMSEAMGRIGLGNYDWAVSLILPIGISFYTFQLLGYLIDVYRGKQEPSSDLIEFGLFVSFFPQLVAGPIERAENLLTQIGRSREFSMENSRAGLILMSWGFFKKLVIADSVAGIANRSFSAAEPSFALVWVGAIAFAVQILADFSGYTDIARGTALLFGFRLSQNFKSPYLAHSMVEFWRRWHITLSNWFRDYIYIPLGGSRRGLVFIGVNVMITFTLTGLWHGAAWNFVAWGVYNGVLVAAINIFSRSSAARFGGYLPRPISVIFTFALVCAGWIMFRAADFSQIQQMLTASPLAMSKDDLRIGAYLFGQVLFYSSPIWIYDVYKILQSRSKLPWRNRYKMRVFVEAIAAAVFVTGAIGFQAADPAQFIYFQF